MAGAVNPNMPQAKKGKDAIMRMGHTAGLYGLDPEGGTPVKEVGVEPPVLKP